MYKIEEITNKIICGDALEVLRQFPNECIDMVITSPPYYGLRKYLPDDDPNKKYEIGLESSFEKYMDKMMEIMKEIKRVMKPTGTCWINFGDAYGGQPAGNKYISEANIGEDGLYVRKMKQTAGAKSFVPNFGFQGKPTRGHSGRARGQNQSSKCLLMVPERFAIRCIDEVGLILRNSIVWAKQVLRFNKDGSKFTVGSVMPSSVKSRFNQSYEYLFFFVKNNKTILWRNEKTKEWVDKKPLGIDGIEGKDWEWRECYNKKPDCKRCQGTGRKKMTLWEGHSYWCDLDAVRIPPQTFENRLMGIEREREWYPNAKINKFAFNYRVRDAEKKAGQPQFRASKEEIEAYKQKTGKIKGGGANLNLPWNPISGGKIYQRNWRQEEAEGYKMGSVDPHRAALRGGLKHYQGKFAGRKDAELFNSPRARTQRKQDNVPSRNAQTYKGFNERWKNRNKVNDPRGNHEGGPGSWRDYQKEREIRKKRGISGTAITPTGKDHNLMNNPDGKNIPTVWLINPEPHNFSREFGLDVEHFATFPQALLEIPIKFGCPPGGIVLDPFMGSGTTAVVAKKLGRNYIGIELNSDYVKLARKRIEIEAPDTLL